MDSGNDRMQGGAHGIGRGIEIFDEVEEFALTNSWYFKTRSTMVI
jgi:hypothetical protein